MQIKVTELFKLGRETFAPGEIRNLDDETAKRVISLGWASDLDGNTGTRDPSAKQLNIQPGVSGQNAEEA